jgi:acid phosphatase type 7
VYIFFPNRYYYKIGHLLPDGNVIWGKSNSFKAPTYPGQKSLQRVVIFGDMGKVIYRIARL